MPGDLYNVPTFLLFLYVNRVHSRDRRLTDDSRLLLCPKPRLEQTKVRDTAYAGYLVLHLLVEVDYSRRMVKQARANIRFDRGSVRGGGRGTPLDKG